jgi:replicative DNA helicase
LNKKKQLTYRTNSTYVVIAEYRLLNALVKKPEFFNNSRVHKELFIHASAKSIYDAILSLKQSGSEITKASLYQKANEIDFNVNEDTVNKVFEVEGSTEFSEETLNDILTVLEKSIKKFNLSKVVNELSFNLNSDNDLDPAFVSSKIFEATEIINLSSNKLMKDLETWSDEYIVELENRMQGLKFPYQDLHLDREVLKGAYPGAVTLIAGPTGSGKSAYALNLNNGFINVGIPSMYFSLEMGGIDTFDRLAALRLGVPLKYFYQEGNDMLPILDAVKKEKEKLKNSKLFFFIEEPNLSLDQIHSMIREFKQKTGHKYIIVTIDLLSQIADFMSNVKGNLTVANSVEIAMNKLNAIAKLEGVHFIAIVQFNRDHEQRIMSIEDVETLRPSLHNVKNSGAYGERSRLVIGLFRKKYYIERYLQNIVTPEEMEYIDDILEAQILKSSSGKIGKIMNYRFEGETFSVLPIEASEIQPMCTGDEEEDE